MVEESRITREIFTPLRWFNVFLFFSSTSFFHGYAILLGIYVALTAYFDTSGSIVFTHPDHPGFKLAVPKGRFFFVIFMIFYLGGMFFSRREHNLKSIWKAFTNSMVTRSGLEYFQAGTLGAEALDSIKGERVLVGIHPHGIYPVAGILAYAGSSPLLKRHPWLRIRPCAASIVFKVPLIREYMIWTGHLDASKRTMSKHMAKGVDDVGLVVGGEQEALLTRNGEETIVLEGRTGFVSLALQHGYHLVPTYAFGQNDLYTVNQSLFAGLRGMLQRKFKVSIPIFWGAYGSNLPHPVKLTLAIGNPIKVPKPPPPPADKKAPKWEPDPDLVAKVHAEYVAEVKALFERHKAAAGYADRELKVVAAKGGHKKGAQAKAKAA